MHLEQRLAVWRWRCKIEKMIVWPFLLVFLVQCDVNGTYASDLIYYFKNNWECRQFFCSPQIAHLFAATRMILARKYSKYTVARRFIEQTVLHCGRMSFSRQDRDFLFIYFRVYAEHLILFFSLTFKFV